MTNADRPTAPDTAQPRWIDRALNSIERAGNTLPDPAALFLILLFVVWGLSALLSPMSFAEIDPRTGDADPVRTC
jgi:aminobenzoyl-glutamate transport protein